MHAKHLCSLFLLIRISVVQSIPQSFPPPFSYISTPQSLSPNLPPVFIQHCSAFQPSYNFFLIKRSPCLSLSHSLSHSLTHTLSLSLPSLVCRIPPPSICPIIHFHASPQPSHLHQNHPASSAPRYYLLSQRTDHSNLFTLHTFRPLP
ncbi:MAG: hypothetical protein J3Q66DRAFT_112101 [Benniella sp.]|nr:MAG: hypothetical protein J3Q66DRAFT_112101 [Benniella sp.]